LSIEFQEIDVLEAIFDDAFARLADCLSIEVIAESPWVDGDHLSIAVGVRS
jgi:hypothetical protein